MKLSHCVLQPLLLLGSCSTALAASWGFSDGTVSVSGKGAGIGGGLREKLSDANALQSPLELGATDTLKVVVTTQEGKSSKKAHQVFLNLRDTERNLDMSYPLTVKENGKGKVDITVKDLPAQFLRNPAPLHANLVIASFGSSEGYNGHVFDITVDSDEVVIPTSADSIRYGKKEEIHHQFREDPKSPPKIITLFFVGTVLASFPVLLGAWLSVGANLDHLSQALGSAPVSHALYFGSIVALEAILFMYYTSWNLFQTLPPLAAVGVVTLISGSRALTEVQERRLAGAR